MSNTDFTLPELETVDELPTIALRGGRNKGTPNPYIDFMSGMEAPKEVATKVGKQTVTKMQWQSFFVPIEPVPETITDPKQRASEAKDRANKLVNKFASLVRRVVDADTTDSVGFALRKQQADANDPTSLGLRVYRTVLDDEKKAKKVQARADKAAKAK
jgi:hypothetical protein